MSTIRVNAIQHTTANASNMTLFANGNVAMTTANTVLTVGNTVISNAGISVGGAAINPLATGMRNRIINGAMMIDQRYTGAANNVNSNVSQYNLDRFNVQNTTDGVITVRQMDAANTSASNYESGAAPAGFTYSQKLTVATADASIGTTQYAALYQSIEGLNVADLDWGTSNAKPVTISFWVKSSVTGSYILELYNSAGNRLYDTTYTIGSANTWQYVAITIPGDTTGTWLKNNSQGIYVRWWLTGGTTYTGGTLNTWGSSFTISGNQTQWMSTLSATFYITGIQFEAGTVATPFEWRHYTQELALCQRYYQKSYNIDVVPGTSTAVGIVPMGDHNGSSRGVGHAFMTTMRASPTMSYWDRVGNANRYSDYYNGSWAADNYGSLSTVAAGQSYFMLYTGASSGYTVFIHYAATAEL